MADANAAAGVNSDVSPGVASPFLRSRYQAAIVQDHRLLLIQHREHETGRAYWVIPGGGREDGEVEEETVRREAFEETSLKVDVVRFLMEEPPLGRNQAGYHTFKTYLCAVISGEAAPGYEPEAEHYTRYSIVDAQWFDLRDIANWGEAVCSDPITHPQLLRIRQVLGYA